MSYLKKSIRIQPVARPTLLEFPLSVIEYHVRFEYLTVPERALLREGS